MAATNHEGRSATGTKLTKLTKTKLTSARHARNTGYAPHPAGPAPVERLRALEDAERTFQMDQDTFRLFYERTARAVWLYLARTTGSDQAADDLLQEVYFRFLRARVTFESDDHRRNDLFRIATNLVRDGRRRPAHLALEDPGAPGGDAADPLLSAIARSAPALVAVAACVVLLPLLVLGVALACERR